MQTKFTYRVLRWTLLCGFAASLATACVVTTGDSDGDAGEGNIGEAGEPSTGGTSGGGASSGGTSTGGKGGTSAGTSSGGTSAGGSVSGGAGAGSDGGAAPYVPGLCESDAPTPSVEPSCTLNEDDNTTQTCRKCLKTSCCTDWQSCYGSEPTVACGYGSTEDAPGQFECIRACYLKDTSGDDAETVLGKCEGECLDQCDADGFADAPTQALLECGQEKCLAECFTP